MSQGVVARGNSSRFWVIVVMVVSLLGGGFATFKLAQVFVGMVKEQPITVEGSANLHLKPNHLYVIYYGTSSHTESTFVPYDPIPYGSKDMFVTDALGNKVNLREARSHGTVTVNDDQFIPWREFETGSSSDYVVHVTGGHVEEVIVGEPVGNTIFGILWWLAVGGCFAVALLVSVIIFISKRPKSHAAAAPGAPPGPSAQPGPPVPPASQVPPWMSGDRMG